MAEVLEQGWFIWGAALCFRKWMNTLSVMHWVVMWFLNALIAVRTQRGNSSLPSGSQHFKPGSRELHFIGRCWLTRMFKAWASVNNNRAQLIHVRQSSTTTQPPFFPTQEIRAQNGCASYPAMTLVSATVVTHAGVTSAIAEAPNNSTSVAPKFTPSTSPSPPLKFH